MSEKKIGRYEIKSELGRGGMATVYLAYDPVLERDVALKLLPNYFAHDPEFSARFEREAKTVAVLEHGSIVSMYDYGEDGEWPYFVMRLMKGGSLKDRIAKGPMSLEEAARIVSRVAGALDKAHSKEIVHRDLKPGNIMFDEDGAAYLGDFGIVKLAESAESYTRTGNTLGTPAYMSPEQADGNPNLDGRSDIYSLGIILYEMLTGTAPYTHESMPRLLIMHLTAPIPNVLAARPDLPAGIQAVIEKAMAKDRDQRYATAAAMATAVQSVLNEKKVTAVPAKAAPIEEIEPEPKPIPMRSAPVIEIEPEPVVETGTAVPAGGSTERDEVSRRVVPKPSSAAPPKPAVKPSPTQPTPTQPAAAKRGGIPKWIYAVGVVVVLAIIGVIALSGGGGDGLDDLPEESAAISEEVVQPVVEDTAGDSSLFNYFDAPDGWGATELFAEGDEFELVDGQAVFTTQIAGAPLITYDDVVGDGTYEVEVTMPDVEWGTAGFGLIIPFDDTRGEWYQFFLWNMGSAVVDYCWDFCYDDYENLIYIEDTGVNTEIGAMNTLKVEVASGLMTFYVNDNELGAIDAELSEGNVGLIILNSVEQELSVVFDNFTYTPAP